MTLNGIGREGSDQSSDQRHHHNPSAGVLAVIDGWKCSLVAIEYAVPIAIGWGKPLTVALMLPGSPPLAAMSPIQICPSNDDLELAALADAAAVLAPSGIAWDFQVVEEGTMATGNSPLVVAVRHRQRPLTRLWWRMVANQASIPPAGRGTTPLLAIPCGRACTRSGSDRLRTTRS